jgi:hypothetical protein
VELLTGLYSKGRLQVLSSSIRKCWNRMAVKTHGYYDVWLIMTIKSIIIQAPGYYPPRDRVRYTLNSSVPFHRWYPGYSRTPCESKVNVPFAHLTTFHKALECKVPMAPRHSRNDIQLKVTRHNDIQHNGRVSFCRLSLCWMSLLSLLFWVSLCWVSLCWMSLISLLF